MSTSSPGVVKKPAGGTGLLGRFKKGNSKDLKKLAKEGGEAAFQGYLKKYKEKDGEWKSRWVEIRGGCLMWCSSKGGGRSDFKDFLELQGARLIDEASLFGLDSLGQARAKASAMVYSVEKGKTRNLGTMKDKMALSRDYSFRIVPKNGQPHIFAADGDHDKEEWWRHILRAINSVSGIEESGTAKAVLEDIPLFSDAKPQSIPRNQVEFDFLSVVGKGAYGRVIKVREKATGNIYVCKVLIKQAILRHRMLREVKKEQALLQQVSHPYIVDLISAFQTRDKIFLVMEFLCGGELFSHMTAEKTKRFSIERTRFYAGQLVLAIEYLHSIKIIHCDLKAENCVLTRDGYMKLTDFGFATTTHVGEKIISRNGTPVYMAPEIIKVNRETGYSYPVDVWSLGVLIYAMLTGYFPFHGDTPAITLRYVCERDLAYPPDVHVSEESKSLLKRCLDRNPLTRITSTQMKEHRFFATTNWSDLLAKKVPSPFVPEVSGSNTRYFPKTAESLSQEREEAMVSMHSVRGGDTVFSGFPFVRSNSTVSQSLQSGQVISGGWEMDEKEDEAYIAKLTCPTPNEKPQGEALSPPELSL